MARQRQHNENTRRTGPLNAEQIGWNEMPLIRATYDFSTDLTLRLMLDRW